MRPFTVFSLVVFALFVPLLFFFIRYPQTHKQYAQTTGGSVSIQDFQFSPPTITVPVGGTVTWTNQSPQNFHTTTSDVQGTTNSWDSGLTNPGQTFSHTFTTPGTYTYHCNVHTFMRGTVIVSAGVPTNTPAPTSTPVPTVPVSSPTPIPTMTSIPTSGSLSPTPTIPPGETAIALMLCPHGIANCGDNANPQSTGNMNPLHTQRSITITVSDLNNNPLKSITGNVTFDSASGTFKGTTDLGTLASGLYVIRVTMPQFLIKRIGPSVIQITSGQTNTTPEAFLIAGDINADNKLDILDYNILASCFGSKATSPACNNQAQAADLNDDGKVDGIDYNLFLRELSVQNGQ